MVRRPAEQMSGGDLPADGAGQDGRRVCKREESSPSRGSAAAGSSSSTHPVSPLIQILEQGIPQRVVKDPTGRVYTGFLCYGHVASSNVMFVPMNSNRAINEEVVESRVRANMENYGRHGEYLDFGQIVLLIVREDTSMNFYVMDGQHRCRTMAVLQQQRPDRVINFQFRAKVVDTEEDSYNELKHFQECYPSDPRSFFRSKKERELATNVLTRIKEELFTKSDLFKSVQQSSRHGQRVGDPNRPYLTDNIIFWMLSDSGLLEEPGATVQSIQRKLQAMNSVMSSLDDGQRHLLGKNVTANMISTAQRMGCFLGLFRDGVLHWRELSARLPQAS
eukprot:gnl/MRDRNA2_/MRDRNA2_121759_c0_seq1.p1 gnl/MRDRNA2_/MRDRNA2_121759_c0~~gnl/MRDRNA2_/MRDRNA2_121759_c0_seq1.p1  ORF type:complete len:334 (-),score=52.86 gnl/MRDRNA2_/MRDRNA2_121759_c0_seq1:5-1006(-)